MFSNWKIQKLRGVIARENVDVLAREWKDIKLLMDILKVDR